MTPSEKAVSLVDYFMAIVKDLEVAKKCAVKVCEEIISSGPTKIVENGNLKTNMPYYFGVIDEIKAIR